jgi:hypothetical protein
MVNVTATADAQVTAYVDLGDWLGVATGNPGVTATPANEASGGSPAYARQQTTWVVSGATAIGTSITINVPAGTYPFLLLCSGSSGANMVDWAPISPQVATVQTTITLTPLAAAS